jgi:DNA repair protein RecO (recombination protein O)
VEQRTKGIVFQTIKFKDHQLIVRIFTERFGLKAFIVRSGKTAKSNLAPYLQPLTIVECSARVKENTDLCTLSNLRIAHPFSHIPFDPVKSSIALFLNEILYKTIADDYQNDDLFEFLVNSLQWLDQSESVRNFHLWFLMELTRYYGFYPSGIEHANDLYFDLAQGTYTALRPAHRNYLEGGIKEQWTAILACNYATIDGIALSGKDRKTMLDYIILYIKLHLDNLREIKSLDVLHSVFSSDH